METHPNPAQAKSDGPNAWPLDRMPALLGQLKRIDDLVKQDGFAELDCIGN
jgi:2-dehydro-3-deoxyphosphooctonate aldolase (KDO 8-P synthase)